MPDRNELPRLNSGYKAPSEQSVEPVAPGWGCLKRALSGIVADGQHMVTVEANEATIMTSWLLVSSDSVLQLIQGYRNKKIKSLLYNAHTWNVCFIHSRGSCEH